MSETPATPTNLVDLLDKLVLPPEPDPVSMIPQTGGWVVLGLLLLVGLGMALWFWRQHRMRNAYRVEALAALDGAKDAARVAEVLRRCALAAYPRAEVAALAGSDWLAFLDRTSGGKVFSQGPGHALADAPYRAGGQADAALIDAARHWVKAHRSELA